MLSAEETRRSSYSVEQIEAGLAAMAMWHGNSRQASRVLKEAGLEIPHTTLVEWPKAYPERFQELREQVVPQVREKLAQMFEVAGMRGAELTIKTMEQFAEKADTLDTRDLPGAIRNISTAAAISVDKSSLLRGLPTEIRQNDSAEDVLKRLQAKHPGMFVEGSAEEIPSVEVVGSSPQGAAQRQLPRSSPDVNAPPA